MTSYITITKDEVGNLWQSVQGDSGQTNDLIYYDFLDLGLVEGQSAEITFDTEKKTYTVRKSRDIGWYLTVYTKHSGIRPRHWDGYNWCANRATNEAHISDDKIKVVSDKLPYNEYLLKAELTGAQ